MSSVNPSSVRAIAKKDFQDAVRSWMFWGLSLLFFFLLVGLASVVGYVEDSYSTESLISILSESTRLVIPLIALILGWKAIVGERESGSLKVMLSLPHSRRDVIIGKLIGRSAVLSLSLIIGFVLAGAVVAAMIGPFGVSEFVGLLAISVIYGVAYVSIAIAISTLTKSSTIAAAAAFGVFVLFYFIWNMLLFAVQIVIQMGYISGVEYTGQTIDGSTTTYTRPPDWALFLDTLDPGNAFNNTLSMVTPIDGVTYSSNWFADGTPFFLSDWFSLLLLLLWIIIPVTIALLWFDRTDI